MGVGQLGGDIQLEVLRVVQLLIANPHDLAVAYLENAFAEHGLQGGINLLKNILQKHREAVLHCILHVTEEACHLEVDHPQFLAFHVLHPLVGLALRIDHKWPAAAAGGDHSILNAEVVPRQAIDLPLETR